LSIISFRVKLSYVFIPVSAIVLFAYESIGYPLWQRL